MFENCFEMVFLAGFVAGCAIRGVYTRRDRQRRATRRRTSAVDAALTGLAGLGLLVLPPVYLFTGWLDFADYGLPRWAGSIGAGAFAAALWLLWRAHVDLGRNWSPWVEVREDQTLVTEGVYRFIRHPMYAAHLLWGVAQALLLPNAIAGPAMLIFFIPLYLFRVGREEQAMLDHFGKPYRDYMDRTGRLLPRWRR